MERYGRDYGPELGRGAEGVPRGYGAWGPAAGWGGEPRTGFDRPGSVVPGRREERWGASTRPMSNGADRVRADDIMTEHPSVVTPETTLQEAARLMEELDVGVLPVVTEMESRRLRGVITDRDITVRAMAHGKDGSSRVAECMTEGVFSVRPHASVHEVLNVMKRERVRRVPVTDGEGRLVGIIAQADLAVHYAGLDLEREAEVEEMVERISEPARPRWSAQQSGWGPESRGGLADRVREGADRVREGWDDLKSGARDLLDRNRR